MLVSPANLPFTKTSRGLTASASANSPLATETRWMLTGLSTTSDLPTVTNKSRDADAPRSCALPAVWVCTAVTAVAAASAADMGGLSQRREGHADRSSSQWCQAVS